MFLFLMVKKEKEGPILLYFLEELSAEVEEHLTYTLWP